MANNTDPAQQAMTSERLAEMRARAENLAEVREVGPHDFSDLEHEQLCSIAMAYHADIPALLAEVERQRGVLEALARAIRFERELKQQEGERHGAD